MRDVEMQRQAGGELTKKLMRAWSFAVLHAYSSLMYHNINCVNYSMLSVGRLQIVTLVKYIKYVILS